MTSDVSLAPGDPAPWFKQRSLSNPNYAFESAAGRYLVLCFLGTAANAAAQAALRAALARPDLFNDVHASFFGVTNDPADEHRLQERYPGYRFLLDFDLRVARLYGIAAAADGEGRVLVRPAWVVLSPDLRTLQIAALGEHEAVLTFLAQLPPPGLHAGFETPAPILVLPNV